MIPELTRHALRMHQLSQQLGLSPTEVLDQLLRYGYRHLDEVFEWRPGMGQKSVSTVAQLSDPVETPTK